jgi:signal transduction histidine kinase
MALANKAERRIVALLLTMCVSGSVVGLVFYLITEGFGDGLFFVALTSLAMIGSLALYLRGYAWGRYTMIITVAVVIGVFMPEPFVTQRFSMAVFAPPVFALIIADAAWVLGSALITYPLLLLRGGPDTIYLDPSNLIFSCFIMGGMALARQLTDDARERVEVQARLLAEERGLLEQRVAERTYALAEANADLVQANKLKDLFLASVSHELRTPLNIILGNVELLRDEIIGPLIPRQHKALTTVDESGQHLLSLIDDLLDMAKLQSGSFIIDTTEVAVAELCEQSVRLIQAKADKRGLTLALSLDPKVKTIQGDARRLRQILLNLLSNAVKFTPAGGTVSLETRWASEGQLVELAVCDTGIGIAPEDISKLFQPFAQLDQRLAREYEGTGLGLALVAQLAALHGGEAGVTSTLGQGSRFWVRMPPVRASSA